MLKGYLNRFILCLVIAAAAAGCAGTQEKTASAQGSARPNQTTEADSLAAEARMSRRTFTRQFKALTGSTVLNWLLTERLHLAQQLLEQTDQSIERIAELAGFGSAETLRHHFRRAFHVAPVEWRRNFRGKVPRHSTTPARWPSRRAVSGTAAFGARSR